MKKLIFVAFCMASASAFAAPACANGTASAPLTAGGTNFIQSSFQHKCSANIYLEAEQNNVAFAAAAGSGKGKNVFGATSAGGTVTVQGPCAATGCTATEPAAKSAALLAAAT
jgi:hypothetical protein